jgi:hypothetical protein
LCSTSTKPPRFHPWHFQRCMRLSIVSDDIEAKNIYTKKGSMKYSLGRHLYATSMNFLIPGHGSPPNVFGDDKNLHRLFFWHASTTIWSNEYWKESRKKGRIEINFKMFFWGFFFVG